MAQYGNNFKQEISTEIEAEWQVARTLPKNPRGQAWEDLVDYSKLRKMMQRARELDERLMKDADKYLSPDKAHCIREKMGGNTLLGNHYAKGDRIFFGYNPSIPRGDMKAFAADGWPPFQYGPVGWPYHNRILDIVKPAKGEEYCDGPWDDKATQASPT